MPQHDGVLRLLARRVGDGVAVVAGLMLVLWLPRHGHRLRCPLGATSWTRLRGAKIGSDFVSRFFAVSGDFYYVTA